MSEMSRGEPMLFEESQPMGPFVRIVAITGMLVLVPAVAIMDTQRGPVHLEAVLGAACAALALAGVAFGRLITRVSASEVVATLRPFPFSRLRLRARDIEQVELYRYGLFGWPGGIGFHFGPGWRAATVSTGTGVLVTRPDGVRCLIGTQRPEALLAALQQLKRTGASAPASVR